MSKRIVFSSKVDISYTYKCIKMVPIKRHVAGGAEPSDVPPGVLLSHL
jgi:hypothetical protein